MAHTYLHRTPSPPAYSSFNNITTSVANTFTTPCCQAATPEISNYNTSFVPTHPYSLPELSIHSDFTSYNPQEQQQSINTSINPSTYISSDNSYTSPSCINFDNQLSLSPSYRLQEKNEILEEIVRECEAIIDRQSSSSPSCLSPTSSFSSLESSPEPSSDGKPVHRVQRKKEQNRAAAIRYREKKRKERDEQFSVMNDLQVINKQLRGKVDDISREVAVMRKLIIELGISPETDRLT